jgi:6-phosphogluconate dehydrogenase
MKPAVGIYGLGTLGINLARNLGLRGYAPSLCPTQTDQQPGKITARYPELVKAEIHVDVVSLVTSLPTPRTLIMMLTADESVDHAIQLIAPHLAAGDVMIDGSNSHFTDTTRRYHELTSKGIHFLGCGFSGGLDGIRNGISVMPGGSAEGYQRALPVLQDIAATALDGHPCCTYIGTEGAGHFVKIVHNGIEYAEMQLFAEVYAILRWAVGLTPDHIAEVLSAWKETDASGYLLDITLKILREKEGDQHVIDSILDSAGHKGTGVYAVQAAAQFGVPAMMTTAALHARYLSGQRHIRSHLDEVTGKQQRKGASMGTTDLYNAFQLARIINYHEGFAIIRAVSKHYGWKIDLAELSRIWTNGCIIRSSLMNRFVKLWDNWDDELVLHPEVKQLIAATWPGLRRINHIASAETLFTPCLVAASQYIAGASLRFPSANLIQAQRDFFGAYGFRNADDPDGPITHHDWRD